MTYIQPDDSHPDDLSLELRKAIKPIIEQYEALGWTNIRLRRPTESTHPGPRIRLSAITPKGKRIDDGFDEDEHLVDKIRSFFKDNSN
jgi:hypothetical protein